MVAKSLAIFFFDLLVYDSITDEENNNKNNILSFDNFHKLIDGYNNIIIIIKSKIYGHIFGIYLNKSISKKQGNIDDPQSFIFLIKVCINIQNKYKLDMLKKKSSKFFKKKKLIFG